MKVILGYLRTYYYETDKRVLILVTLFTAICIGVNYRLGLDKWIDRQPDSPELVLRTTVFLLAFGLPYAAYAVLNKKKYFKKSRFWLFLFLGPFLFALKMVLYPILNFSNDYGENSFWNAVFYWPALMFFMIFSLFVIWRVFDREQPFYGVSCKGLDLGPYLLMLLIMVPLVAAASTQEDFLAVYPKLDELKFSTGVMELQWWHKLIFELSYGTDFVSIELFFRGFLILAFVKWAGKDAILPMACFYCTIHFGKPLGECISSYFGGLLLGVVVYNTRTILGGLIVHLGIAWMMEAGGYLGQSLK